MYEIATKGKIKHLDFILLDFLCMHVSLMLAFLLRYAGDYAFYYDGYMLIAIIYSMCFGLTVLFYAGYKNILKRGVYKEMICTIKMNVMVSVLVVLVLFMIRRSESSSRAIFVMNFAMSVILSFSIRMLHKNSLLKKGGNKNHSLIVICLEENAEHFLDCIAANGFGINVTGIITADRDKKGTSIRGIPVVANADDAVMYMCRNWVDEIFIGKQTNDAMPEFSENLQLACRKMGITVHTMLLPLKREEDNTLTEKFAGFLVMTQSVATVTRGQMFIKRAMDIMGGAVGCFLTLILFIFVAPCIKIASPGPIFFSQKRVGKNGKIFKIYKFRSMYLDAEERKKELMKQNKVKDGMMFKVDKDPRIIKGIGHFIRDYSIDEFPQFFNVLKGDMSLVGTRPPTLDEWEKYELHHRKRLAIKPGLTGMWQVSGRSKITDFEDIVKLDTQYIENWSIGFDIKIILKTIVVVLKRDGSQ